MIFKKAIYIADSKVIKKALLVFFFSPSYLDIGEIKKRPMEVVNTEVMQIIVTVLLCVSYVMS